MRLYLNLCIPVGGELGLEAALEALAALDRVYLRSHPDTPELYEAGVRYLRDAEDRDQGRPRAELWLTVPDVLRVGGADCKCLAAWRVAELRELGEDARHHIVRMGPHVWHIQVRRADGTIEDPSRELGMKG